MRVTKCYHSTTWFCIRLWFKQFGSHFVNLCDACAPGHHVAHLGNFVVHRGGAVHHGQVGSDGGVRPSFCRFVAGEGGFFEQSHPAPGHQDPDVRESNAERRGRCGEKAAIEKEHKANIATMCKDIDFQQGAAGGSLLWMHPSQDQSHS